MRFQVNAIFAVHSRKGLVFGSTVWVSFEEICFEVDAQIDPTEVIDWRMELTGLTDTVMGSLKVDRTKPNARNELPIYVAKILTMADRDRELFHTWLEDRSGSSPSRRREDSSSVTNTKKQADAAKADAKPPKSEPPRSDPRIRSTVSGGSGGDSRSERYGLGDRSSRRRNSAGRQAIRDALRASLHGAEKGGADKGPERGGAEAPKTEEGARDRRNRKLAWLEDTMHGETPPWLSDMEKAEETPRPDAKKSAAAPSKKTGVDGVAAPSAAPRSTRRSPVLDEDVNKPPPPEYEFPSLEQTVDVERPVGLRFREGGDVADEAPAPPSVADDRRAPPAFKMDQGLPPDARARERQDRALDGRGRPEAPPKAAPRPGAPGSKPAEPKAEWRGRETTNAVRPNIGGGPPPMIEDDVTGIDDRKRPGGSATAPARPGQPARPAASPPGAATPPRPTLPTIGSPKPGATRPTASQPPASADDEYTGATPILAKDLPGRQVSVLPRSRPPQVTVHYRDRALYAQDYEQHLRGGGIVIQLPDLDTSGMRAFIRLVLPSGKDVRCRAEVVALLPDGAGVQLQLRPEDKELLKSEAERP